MLQILLRLILYKIILYIIYITSVYIIPMVKLICDDGKPVNGKNAVIPYNPIEIIYLYIKLILYIILCIYIQYYIF